MWSNGTIGYANGAMVSAAYLADLRHKFVQGCERGKASQAAVAQFFNVSLSFVERLLRLHSRTGDFSQTGSGRATRRRSIPHPAPKFSIGCRNKTTFP
jgi:hypothetical protein